MDFKYSTIGNICPSHTSLQKKVQHLPNSQRFVVSGFIPASRIKAIPLKKSYQSLTTVIFILMIFNKLDGKN
jgi:hypothetical protein